LWDDDRQADLETRARQIVADVVRRAEEIAAPAPADMFDDMYGTDLDAELDRQRRTMRTSSLGQDPSQIEGGAPARSATPDTAKA
jgi:hypothetical protein